jgi:hypothetical protein
MVLVAGAPIADADSTQDETVAEEAAKPPKPQSQAESREALLATALADPQQLRPVHGLDLDLSPIISLVAAFLRDHGVEAIEHRRRPGKAPDGLSALFDVGGRLPAVRLQIGDDVPELFGAFYRNKGIRGALIWPMRYFTLRIEGGEASEFGYFGIAGFEWAHPNQRMAFGFGIPMNLRNARGSVGAIAQFRMKLF